jgi:hypothetical protein
VAFGTILAAHLLLLLQLQTTDLGKLHIPDQAPGISGLGPGWKRSMHDYASRQTASRHRCIWAPGYAVGYLVQQAAILCGQVKYLEATCDSDPIT